MAEAPKDQPPSPEFIRAEQLVDSWSSSLSVLASRWSRDLLRTIALAREEVEDIWAEAEDLSRRDQ